MLYALVHIFLAAHAAAYALSDYSSLETRLYPGPDVAELHPPGLLSDGTIRSSASQAVPETLSKISTSSTMNVSERAGQFWMETVPHGQMPWGSQDYKFFRNVKDYGAKGDGTTDDSDAINKAITDGNRCGKACGSTSVSEALVYFPSGTYLISKPLIQYYATQFVGSPLDRPIIKGSSNFVGIALIDTDPYIPGANGDEWYVNQNQFYRQIRNFILDMTVMPDMQIDPVTHWATFNATGIHWQVAQATSLQYIDFMMPQTDKTHAIGLYMENGSGGFVSELLFSGGDIGFKAGSQQYTARALQFKQCNTAIQMVWDWGMTWKSLVIDGCHVGIDCTSFGGPGSQGTGSIAVLDSSFSNVRSGITIPSNGWKPSILLDNLGLTNTPNVVVTNAQSPILAVSGDKNIQSWAMGPVYSPNAGDNTPGYLSSVPNRPINMVDNHGHWLELPRPHYGNDPPTAVATANGIKNDGTGDQSDAINTFLKNNVGKVVFFPAGVYAVEKTVFVPVGSRIVGEGWSQFSARGPAFADATRPTPMIKVGNSGDVGVIEMSDLMFTVRGANPGAVLLEWNVKADSKGVPPAMWDCHFRVGGTKGSELQLEQCPPSQGSNTKPECMGAAMLMHVTAKSNGYFENVWAWVADHDLDHGGDSDAASVQLSVFVGRGVLIESQGPSWFYGTASEHSQMYQYQLLGAKNIFMGHVQTETPYYQPKPLANKPFTPGRFPCDPAFASCNDRTNPNCREAWALRILGSEDVYIYSAGFYSFFQNYNQDCVKTETCQDHLVMTSGNSKLWFYNLFTKGSVEAISPSNSSAITAKSVQNGFTTEITAFLLGSGSRTPSVDDRFCASAPSEACIPPAVANLQWGTPLRIREL